MNTINQQSSVESQPGQDGIIDTKIDDTDTQKDNAQEELEGAEPSADETAVNPEDAKISRSE